MFLVDAFGRPLRNLRLSVTDRCNLRCQYCMPEENYTWLPRRDVLHFGELCALVDVFIGFGVDKVRLTGGEPLLRHDLPRLVGMLTAREGLRDIALTTNGVLLADQIDALRVAGLHRVTVSLDTLRPDRFKQLARVDALDAVRAGVAAARRAFGRLKIDVVVIRGVNDDELSDLIEYGREHDAEVRFIEYMDVGGATRWSPDLVVPRRQILAGLEARYGPVAPIADVSSATANRFSLADGTTFGVISSPTRPFCGRCDRSRITADGMWYLCLYAPNGIDLRAQLREGAAAEELKALIASIWLQRCDRGAERRLEFNERRTLVPIDVLRGNPHLEMHTRGG